MPDREKVIKGLTACVDDMCDYCPYYDEEVPSWDYYGRCNRIEMNRDALALLREHEQKAEWQLSRPHHFICSGCGAQWGQAVIGMRYCPTCGRKMTLSAEERRREWPEEVSGDE